MGKISTKLKIMLLRKKNKFTSFATIRLVKFQLTIPKLNCFSQQPQRMIFTIICSHSSKETISFLRELWVQNFTTRRTFLKVRNTFRNMSQIHSVQHLDSLVISCPQKANNQHILEDI